MVSGTMRIEADTVLAGSGAIATQRGDANWGANWLYNHEGLQNDVYVISEVFKNFSTSGAYATDAEVAAASGAATALAIVNIAAASGAVVITASGKAVADDIIMSGVIHDEIVATLGSPTASGAAVVEASGIAASLDADVRTLVYSASGTIETTTNTLLYAASGTLRTDLELQDYNASGAITTATDTLLYSASGAITTNGVFDGITFSNSIIPVGSGVDYIGSANHPIAISGLYFLADDGTICRLMCPVAGMLSGVAATY